jgi:hypothetical protein
MGWPEAGSIFPPGFGKVIQGMSELKNQFASYVLVLAPSIGEKIRHLASNEHNLVAIRLQV